MGTTWPDHRNAQAAAARGLRKPLLCARAVLAGAVRVEFVR